MPESATLTPRPPVAPPVEEESLYEVINDQRVELPPMGSYEVRIASLLFLHLGPFVREQGLGSVDSEMLYLLNRSTRLQRRPDLAFVSYERWPRDRRIPRPAAAWDVVPDLAVEVVSPTDAAEELLIKLHHYFQAGVRLVWVIYPSHCQVYAYESPTRVQVLARADDLVGGAVVPGFRLPLAQLFEDVDPPAAAAGEPG